MIRVPRLPHPLPRAPLTLIDRHPRSLPPLPITSLMPRAGWKRRSPCQHAMKSATEKEVLSFFANLKHGLHVARFPIESSTWPGGGGGGGGGGRGPGRGVKSLRSRSPFTQPENSVLGVRRFAWRQALSRRSRSLGGGGSTQATKSAAPLYRWQYAAHRTSQHSPRCVPAAASWAEAAPEALLDVPKWVHTVSSALPNHSPHLPAPPATPRPRPPPPPGCTASPRRAKLERALERGEARRRSTSDSSKEGRSACITPPPPSRLRNASASATAQEARSPPQGGGGGGGPAHAIFVVLFTRPPAPPTQRRPHSPCPPPPAVRSTPRVADLGPACPVSGSCVMTSRSMCGRAKAVRVLGLRRTRGRS
jgi:hypothetical protein